MKKGITAICLLGLMMLILSGCGSNGGVGGSSSDTGSASATTVGEELARIFADDEEFDLKHFGYAVFPASDIAKDGTGHTSRYWEYAIVYSTEPEQDVYAFIGLFKIDPEKALSLSRAETLEEDGTWLWKCLGECVEGAHYGDMIKAGGCKIFTNLNGFPGSTGPIDLYFGYAPYGEYKKDGVIYEANDDDNSFCFFVPAGKEVDLDWDQEDE